MKRFQPLTPEKEATLLELRKKAIDVMRALHSQGPRRVIAHGSIARGDVDKHSDIDISILDPTPSYVTEYAFETSHHKIRIIEKKITMATPNHAIKGHILLENGTEVVFPLCSLRQRETEFYKFSGFLMLNEIQAKDGLIRVCGVNKRLLMIKPTSTGYWEESILGKEHETARKLRVSVEVVRERVRVLSQRDKVGRTGQFISLNIPPDSHFETMLKQLQDRNPAVRRRLRY